MKLPLRRKRVALVTLVILTFISNFVLQVNACTTIIVGKDASTTGKVIIAHNEDNGGRLVTPVYKMPRLKHEPGTMITFESSSAQIPQVEETWSFIWSECRTATGASFSDGFVNEWGVAVNSDSCSPSREDSPVLVDGGVGYGIRRIIAERATTAREGVEIAVDLVETYGYNASGRSYQIADKNEAWLLQLVNGKQYVAQRVPDDEVVVMPNRYIIHGVDLEDTENFIASPTLITYAIERGWYTPAVEGDYSDFSFARAYQKPSSYTDYDVRQKNGQRIILGSEPEGPLQFSIKPNRKIGVEDLKEILRSHYVGTADDLSNNYEISPYRTSLRVIDASHTNEGDIIQFDEDPNFTVMWHGSGRNNTSPFVPWYLGMTSVPKGFSWIDPIEATDSHFSASPEDFDFNADYAFWTFNSLQTLAELKYGDIIDEVAKDIESFEKNWANRQKGIETAAKAQAKKDNEKAMKFLTEYSHDQAAIALDWANKKIDELIDVEIDIQADEIKRGDDNTVSVAILSDDEFDATNVDPSTVRFGLAYRNPYTQWASVISSKLEDVNNNQKLDLVVTFSNNIVVPSSSSLADCYADIYMYGFNEDGEIFTTRDFANIAQ